MFEQSNSVINDIAFKMTKSGGHRYLLERDLSNRTSNILVKVEKITYNTEALARKRMQELVEAQKVAKDIFGKSYMPSRFIRVVEINKKYCIITHELRKDIYPSNNQDVFNLCFLGSDDTSLVNLIQTNNSAKLAITTFLDQLKLYFEKTAGCILDLMGNDNVVLCKNGDEYSVVINNSAVKMWKFAVEAPNYVNNRSIPRVRYLCKIVGIKDIFLAK